MNRKNVEDLYPLSPLQQGMLFHTLYSPGTGAYLEQLALTLVGPVHVEPFRRAWQRVVDRHPVLRSGFVWEGVPQPLQVVFRQVELPFEYEDWRELPAEERERRFNERMETERVEGLDLARPQVAARLYRTGDHEHRFVLTTHHMVLDGWSLPIVLGEFGALYGGFVHGQEPRLPARRPFREYIAWLNRQDAGATEAFWRARLAGFQAPTPLPLDRDPSRAGAPAEGHAQERADFPADLAAGLEQAARRLRVTPSGVLQCAWGAVLAAYAGERDVVFGATVSGRPPELPGVEEMVGMFINTVPVRIRVPRGVTVEAWVQAAHREQSEARLYEHAQLARVRTWSEVPPEGSLFETLLVFENYPLDALQDGGGAQFDAAEDEPEEEGFRIAAGSSPERTNYPLSLVAAPSPTDFRLTATYDPSRLDAASVRTLLDGLGRVLRQMVDDPRRLAEELTPLGADELRAVLHGFNGETVDVAPNLTVARMFEGAAARTPDAVALEHRGERTTYAELNARANRLARQLRELGVGPEVSVGVCLDRTPELVVALLAVLKAGGGYVPLDPNYPAERLGWVVEDAAAPVVIAQERTVPALPPTPARVLRVDAEREAIASRSPENLDVLAAPESLAWTLYTSGSTGRPKGVQIEQRGAVTLLHWMRRWVPQEELGGVLFSTSISFDVSVAELFFTLSWGGRVVLVENALSLAELGDEAGVVRAAMVPAAAAELARLGRVPRTVRTFALGGEPLPPATAEAMYALGHVRRVENLYGPTEDTTYSCAWIVPRGVQRMLVGRPVGNGRGYVLDDALRPVPAGARGEVYLAGDGISRGYRGRPGQTAERYLPDPFGPPGARMYRTGDLARRLETGELDYLGRADFQVKVRGFRIELGEIESTLLAHPAVDEAVVVAVPDGEGAHRLVAYIAPAGADAAELRAHLAASLPDYMVPSAAVGLDALPRTPNGKVDRAALPDPGAPEAAQEYVAPRTMAEEALAEIWVEVLKLERAGATDNFFALGGHSLLATQVVSRVRAVFGVELPLRALFEHPTLESLATVVEDLLMADLEGMDDAEASAAADASAADAAGAGPSAVVPVARGGDLPDPILPVSRDEPLPVSFAQERLWFLQQLDPASALYNLPTPMRFRGELDEDALRRTLDEIVRRHEALRTVFALEGGAPVQRILPPAAVPLPVHRLDPLPEAERLAEAWRMADEETVTPFDLERGPVFRAMLLRLADDDHLLMLNFHHVVSDGWSIGVFSRELLALYGAYRAGRPSPLPELPVQFADFAAWQRAWLTPERVGAQVAYWTRQLAGAPPALELPTDRPRAAVQRHRGAVRSLLLPRDAREQVHALAVRNGATLAMTVLAAFQLVLGRLAGQDDVVVGTPIAGRTRPETEAMIGLFLNTLAIRTKLAGEETFAGLLGEVRETMLGAYAHQDVPFERLLEELSPDRTLSRTPVFQVLFNMLNLEGSYAGDSEELEAAGLRPVPFDVDLEVGAKFDLTLYVQELEDGLRFDATYDADLFDGDRIDGMMRQLAEVLRQAAGDPSLRLDDVSLLTDDARAALPDPDVRFTHAWHGPVHAAFAARAAETPDAPALVGVDGTWSYADVEAASNRVARYLREEGIRRRDVVAVYAHRGPWLPVALLGISKAGAAWTVLDPAYPAAALVDRMQVAMPLAWLQDAAAGDLHPELEEEVNAQPLRARLTLGGAAADPDTARLASVPAERVAAEVIPEDLAYLAFTSGTTGEPKAVAGTHRPLSHFFRWYADELAPTSADRFTLLSGLAHDPLLRDVFAPLMTGAALCIPDAERIAEPGYLGGWFAEQAVTVTHLTPAMGRLLASSDAVHLPQLRLAAFGGDVLTARDVASIRRLAPSVEVVNLYGATETPQAMGFHRVSAGPGGPDREPVGRGIDGVQLLVLTPAGRLAGVGEVGEIVVRTHYLSRGYRNDAALTAARFRPSPLTGDPADSVYFTGDLGRYRPDGAVEAVGRADRQVQVRGFRVEPGEVEAALAGHPAVRAAAVVPRAGADGGKTLAAYVVADAEDVAAELRPWLAARLPDYMVPTAFVRLDALPLTANGKLDVAALPDPEHAAPEVYVAPRTAAEQVVAEIWAEVLGRERVGAEDNFFALGGHSLLATQVLSRVEQAFGVKLPVRALFEEPTVAALAARLEASGEGTLAEAMAELDGLSEEELMALLTETEGAEGA